MDFVEITYRDFEKEMITSNKHFYNEGYADAIEAELKWIPLNKDNFDTFCGKGIIYALDYPVITKFSKKDNNYIYINDLRNSLDEFYKRVEASRLPYYFLPLDFPSLERKE